MGLFDFLTGGNDPQKTIDKIKRRLMDQYRQTHERYEAIDELVKIGSPAALEAMLERFTLRVSGPTIDEEEKQYCYEKISSWGQAALGPLEKFIATREAVYFPLRALRDMAGDDAAVDALLKAMDSCDPGYHEGLDRLREIVTNLRDFRHDKVREALVKLLASRSNEIRFFALDGLSSYPHEEVAAHFAGRLLDATESQRVKMLACELAMEHGISLAAWAEALRPLLPQSFALGEDGLLTHA